MRLTLFAASLAFLLASPATAQVLPGGHHNNTNDVAGYQAQVRMQAMALTGRWASAFMKNDAERLAAMYMKDAVMLGADGAVARTRKSIQESLVQAVPLIDGVQMTVDDFDLSGEMVYIAGRFTYDVEQRGGGILRQVGPFSMVLRRDFDTSDWQIRSHMTPGPLVQAAAEDGAPQRSAMGPAVAPSPVAESPAAPRGSVTDSASTELLRQAAVHYERARAAQKVDDWTTYGAEMERLGEVLRKVEAGRGTE
jgi:ketosteroid isomerase-like protein